MLQKKSFKGKSEGWEYLQKMQSSAERMQKLIDDLLNYSKMAAQKRSFKRHDFEKIVANVLKELDDQIKHHSQQRINESDLRPEIQPLLQRAKID